VFGRREAREARAAGGAGRLRRAEWLAAVAVAESCRKEAWRAGRKLGEPAVLGCTH
jgi:hypothetical protein